MIPTRKSDLAFPPQNQTDDFLTENQTTDFQPESTEPDFRTENPTEDFQAGNRTDDFESENPPADFHPEIRPKMFAKKIRPPILKPKIIRWIFRAKIRRCFFSMRGSGVIPSPRCLEYVFGKSQGLYAPPSCTRICWRRPKNQKAGFLAGTKGHGKNKNTPPFCFSRGPRLCDQPKKQCVCQF